MGLVSQRSTPIIAGDIRIGDIIDNRGNRLVVLNVWRHGEYVGIDIDGYSSFIELHYCRTLWVFNRY